MGKIIAGLILRLLGWSTVLSPAPARKTVIIFYPHTSNWDFPLGVLFRAKHQLQRFVHWLDPFMEEMPSCWHCR